MAELVARLIIWRRDSPYGTYVATNIVSMAYDTSSGSIVVRKNGIVITSGDSIPLIFTYAANPATYYKTEIDYDPLICDGDNRIKLLRDISAFPYVTKKTYTNNPSCNVSQFVCDLQVNSLPVITNETSEGASDGEIEVTATSSNDPIEYRLNSDFVYGDGTAQSTGEFTGLTSGSYRIYIRDSANCSANILVNVSFDKTYTTKYVLEYDDRVGDVTKIEIQERDYVGSSTEIKGGDVPAVILLRGEGEDNKFKAILGSEIELTITSETNYQFQDLFTSDPNKYRIVYKKDFGSGFEELLTTKLLPNQYKETYSAPPYYVNFTSTDGLASLNEIPFLDGSGARFFGSYKVIELIAYLLKNTGLELSIRVAINLYALDMDSAASDDPLDQAFVDTDTYYQKDIPTCLDVLKWLLEPFGAHILQWGNVWNIIHVEERISSFDYRLFDANGEYVSNSSYNPTITISTEPTTGVMWQAHPTLEMNNAYGSIVLNYNLGLRENLLTNGDFKLKTDYFFIGGYLPAPDITGFQLVPNGDDGAIVVYQIVEQDKVKPYNDSTGITAEKNNVAIGIRQATGNAYIKSKTYSVKLGANDQLAIVVRCGLPTFSIEIPYVKVRVVVQYGTFYLTGDGEWSSSYNEIVYFVKEYGKFVELKTTSTSVPTGASDGLDLIVTVYHAYAFHAEFISVASQRAKVTVGLGIGHRTEREDSGNFDLFYYELENNTSAESVPDIIRPNDYHATTNPVQWILKSQRDLGFSISDVFYIDRIAVQYYFNGAIPPSTFDASINCEDNNPNIMKVEVMHGSLAEVVQTNTRIVPIFSFNPSEQADIQYIDVVIQNNTLTYMSYFRDVDGVGYENWSRSYLSESRKLHDILLRSLAAQYNHVWRRIRGSLAGVEFVTPINSLEETDGLIYYPMAMRIDDKNRIFDGEYVELSSVGDDDDPTDPDTEAAFSTGFSIGFNA